MKPSPPAPSRPWTFLSNHAHVLVCLAADPDSRLRDIAARVAITERAVQKIVGDLEDVGVIVRVRHGRRNSYRLDVSKSLRHPLEAHCTIGALLALVVDGKASKRTGFA